MRIVITNDDGIDAPGLDTLHQCVRRLGNVVIVAPRQPQSGIAHRVTARDPIRFDQVGPDRFCIDGTPADCARIALKRLAPDAGWLIAGINPGANLGSDVYNSGTVAAAREAAILGCRAIAISQYIARDQKIDWAATAYHSLPVLRMLLDRDLMPGHFWNINLPHPLSKKAKVAHEFCGLDTHPHDYTYDQQGDTLVYRGIIHNRPRDAGKDVAVCFDEGKIAITRLAVDSGAGG
ncbi:MAG: 5'/3'-nucleotidase SurE [Desulfobacterales bacterium]|nr:5'/3'-nucleotidase SurE [Desulfobacterales bacterium]